eukprot:TRINITY_DN17677_c0_g1_i1.p3 TRINITY_DN17677_c0_g1~~TRINITY_DN17677_c0_g1_i1.p3  ORF type:complete len:168 (+),score=48.40 TRINITY_DN17677_c0_g1_i1:702-1205(+)
MLAAAFDVLDIFEYKDLLKRIQTGLRLSLELEDLGRLVDSVTISRRTLQVVHQARRYVVEAGDPKTRSLAEAPLAQPPDANMASITVGLDTPAHPGPFNRKEQQELFALHVDVLIGLFRAELGGGLLAETARMEDVYRGQIAACELREAQQNIYGQKTTKKRAKYTG